MCTLRAIFRYTIESLLDMFLLLIDGFYPSDSFWSGYCHRMGKKKGNLSCMQWRYIFNLEFWTTGKSDDLITDENERRMKKFRYNLVVLSWICFLFFFECTFNVLYV